MKAPFSTLLLTIALIGGSALAAEKPQGKPTTTSAIAASTTDFIAKLPAKVFVLITTKDAKEKMMRSLQSLGPTPNTEFFVLPAEATRPTPTRQVSPEFPRGAGQGQALIMALISPTGEITAVHCLAANQPAFAVSAAQAVAKWKFKPGTLKNAAVPVLFTQLIEFNIENY